MNDGSTHQDLVLYQRVLSLHRAGYQDVAGVSTVEGQSRRERRPWQRDIRERAALRRVPLENLGESPGKKRKGLTQGCPLPPLSGGPYLGSAGEVGDDIYYLGLLGGELVGQEFEMEVTLSKERPAISRIPKFLWPSQLNWQGDWYTDRECSISIECELGHQGGKPVTHRCE